GPESASAEPIVAAGRAQQERGRFLLRRWGPGTRDPGRSRTHSDGTDPRSDESLVPGPSSFSSCTTQGRMGNGSVSVADRGAAQREREAAEAGETGAALEAREHHTGSVVVGQR